MTPVQSLVRAFFVECQRSHVDSATAAVALVDIMAVIAGTLELQGDHQPLDDRIDVFVEHLRARYPEILSSMIVNRASQKVVQG